MPLPALHCRSEQVDDKTVIAPPICHCEEAAGRRGALSAKREEVPLGCNLGKALPIYTECRRTQSLSNLTVAALSERHGGLQYAPHCLYGARLSDLSLRGAKRRGNLGKAVAFSPEVPCYPAGYCEIATAPLGPRNDKLGSLAPQNACRKDCQHARRSLPVKGTPHP